MILGPPAAAIQDRGEPRTSRQGFLAAHARCISLDPYILKSSNSTGFTLIELMVVISIIVILSTFGLVQYRHSIIHSQEAVLRDDLFKMRDAIDQYYADKNAYPESLDALVSDGYIRAVPKDPFTRSDGTWETVPSEPDPANPTAAPGIYDVKSGAEGTALDGSRYSDW